MYLKLIGFAYTKVSSSFRQQCFSLWNEKRTRLKETRLNSLSFIEQRRLIVGVSNGLCEHLRTCEQYVYFCEHEQLSNFSREQWRLKKYRWRAASTLEKTQMASSGHFEYFVNFPLAGISLLLIEYVVLRRIIAYKLADISKTEQ